RNAWISVCRVADEGEEVRDQRASAPVLLPPARRIADRLPFAIHLYDAVPADALRQILVGSPDADFLHARISRGDVGRGGERVVGLELDHGPYGHAHGGEGGFERVELREQSRLDASPRLVLGPERVAEGLDDVVGRDPDVGGPLLDQLQYRMQHAADGAEGRVCALGEATPAVELAEQLVRSVHEMNDHRAAVGLTGGFLVQADHVPRGIPDLPAEHLGVELRRAPDVDRGNLDVADLAVRRGRGHQSSFEPSGAAPPAHAAARARSRWRSRALRVSEAARSNSARASSKRPS